VLADPGAVTARVDAHRPERDRGGRRVGGAAAQHGAHAQHQLADAERLDHVVVGADLEADDDVDLLGLGGHHDHRQAPRPLAGADLLAHLRAGHVGEHEVEQDEVDAPGVVGDRRERLLAGVHGDRPEALALQRVLEGRHEVALVFHDQDGARHVSSADRRYPLSRARGRARAAAIVTPASQSGHRGRDLRQPLGHDRSGRRRG
jgi:hypothetical protein